MAFFSTSDDPATTNFEQLLQMDQTRIHDEMQRRRSLMERQLAADNIKSALCDQLRKDKLSVPGLQDRVANLEYSDPQLFAYIRRLEFVQDGIWCTKCDTIKNIGVPRPTQQPAVHNSTQQPAANKPQPMHNKDTLRQSTHILRTTNPPQLNSSQPTVPYKKSPPAAQQSMTSEDLLQQINEVRREFLTKFDKLEGIVRGIDTHAASLSIPLITQTAGDNLAMPPVYQPSLFTVEYSELPSADDLLI